MPRGGKAEAAAGELPVVQGKWGWGPGHPTRVPSPSPGGVRTLGRKGPGNARLVTRATTRAGQRRACCGRWVHLFQPKIPLFNPSLTLKCSTFYVRPLSQTWEFKRSLNRVHRLCLPGSRAGSRGYDPSPPLSSLSKGNRDEAFWCKGVGLPCIPAFLFLLSPAFSDSK